MSTLTVEARMKSVCCIIGAGYSFVAGLPLARDLLTSDLAVVSKSAAQRFQWVWGDYARWQQGNPSRGPEEYLADLYRDPASWEPTHPCFSWAVELVAVALATPRGRDVNSVSPRYGPCITWPSRCAIHTAFWATVRTAFDDVAAVTTNYGLLIERSLRHRPMMRGFGPGFYYGGLIRPQVLKGTALPFTVTNPQRFVKLTGTIPVYKLHGSLNWARIGSSLELYQDMRPAFRHGGDAAIVPPASDKQTPSWLRPVWEEAEKKLSDSDCWIVCGYSLPSYDVGIERTLKRAAKFKTGIGRIFILDPFSEHLRDKYQQVAPSAEIHCLSGLPKGIGDLRVHL